MLAVVAVDERADPVGDGVCEQRRAQVQVPCVVGVLGKRVALDRITAPLTPRSFRPASAVSLSHTCVSAVPNSSPIRFESTGRACLRSPGCSGSASSAHATAQHARIAARRRRRRCVGLDAQRERQRAERVVPAHLDQILAADSRRVPVSPSRICAAVRRRRRRHHRPRGMSMSCAVVGCASVVESSVSGSSADPPRT